MNDSIETYSETTDLYREILREAQRIEDKKLIQIIQKRLQSLGTVSCFTSSGCEIISFPGSMTLPIQPPEDGPFWPKFDYIQPIIILIFYLVLIATHSIWQ